MRLGTKLVSFEACPGDPHRAVSTPIYQTATFGQPNADGQGAYDYSRSGNPTRSVLEEQLAVVEGARHGLAFASGMAALAAIVELVEQGDEIVAGDDLYGGTYRLLSTIVERRGVRVRYVDLADVEKTREAVTERTKLVIAETPTNPLLRIVDVRAVAAVCKEKGAVLVVDNTAMSPVVQRPLELGADVVIHSATKFLSGHSDITAGAVMANDDAIAGRLRHVQNALGSALAPFEAWLLLRGMKTMELRVERQQRTAQRVAEVLAGHGVTRDVFFPGLANHPGRTVHEGQADGPGCVLSFTTGDVETSKRIVESLKLFTIAVSFGGVGSVASLPGYMSHASIPEAVRKERGLPEDLVRLAIGIENEDDVVEDLVCALDGAEKVRVRVSGTAEVGAR